MKAKKFMRAIEKKDKFPEVYDGLVIKETPNEIEMICQGPDTKDRISQRHFRKKDWEFELADRDDVRHLFLGAVHAADKKLLDAEFDLEDAKFAVKKQNEFLKEVFG